MPARSLVSWLNCGCGPGHTSGDGPGVGCTIISDSSPGTSTGGSAAAALLLRGGVVGRTVYWGARSARAVAAPPRSTSSSHQAPRKRLARVRDLGVTSPPRRRPRRGSPSSRAMTSSISPARCISRLIFIIVAWISGSLIAWFIALITRARAEDRDTSAPSRPRARPRRPGYLGRLLHAAGSFDDGNLRRQLHQRRVERRAARVASNFRK